MTIAPDMPSGALAPAPVQPGLALLRRLPDTLAGPVHLAVRRHIRRDWLTVHARLRATTLVLSASHPVPVLHALDVRHITLLSSPSSRKPSLIVHSSAAGSEHDSGGGNGSPAHARLRFTSNAADWFRALSAVASVPLARLPHFSVLCPIGKGGGGEVYLAHNAPSSRQSISYGSGGSNGGAVTTGAPLLALKSVQKRAVFTSAATLRRALDERLALELVRAHPFVATLTHAFQTDTALYMATLFCPGGDLRAFLRRQPANRLSENRARPILAQLVLALEHVHSLSILFRDLKPENVLLAATGDVRLCDFGLCKVLPRRAAEAAAGKQPPSGPRTQGRAQNVVVRMPQSKPSSTSTTTNTTNSSSSSSSAPTPAARARSFCGSTMYMSPQVVTGEPYGFATDMWSLGALFFRVLVGRAPFEQVVPKNGAKTTVAGGGMPISNDAADVQRRIVRDVPAMPTFLSRETRAMLQALLRKREADRMTLAQLKAAPYFQGIDWARLLDDGCKRAAAETVSAATGAHVGGYTYAPVKARRSGGLTPSGTRQRGDEQATGLNFHHQHVRDAQQQLDDIPGLANFDAQRLISHGVALRDAAMHDGERAQPARRRARRAGDAEDDPPLPAGERALSVRKASRVASSLSSLFVRAEGGGAVTSGSTALGLEDGAGGAGHAKGARYIVGFNFCVAEGRPEFRDDERDDVDDTADELLLGLEV